MKGLVIKKNADLFTIECDGKIFERKSRGNLKKDGVFVGDFVEFDDAITKVLPRKNVIIRPPLANLDKIFVVISQIPKPDFLLVDKMILCCFSKGITPILVVNKEDIFDKGFLREIKSIYKNVVKIVVCSAKEGNIENLKKQIKGICAFAGQSAVGKSSLINTILGSRQSEVGDLSKIERGKQTTRLVTLFKVAGGYIADTAGFSSLEIGMVTDLAPQEIDKFYPDFLPYLSSCKYRTCNHKNSTECRIIAAVNAGKINETRYKNFLKIFDNLTDFKQKYK